MLTDRYRDFAKCLPKNNKEFTEQDYKDLQNSDFPYKGFAYFAYSYSGKFKGGWRRDGEGKRDYVSESYRNALKQSEKIRGVLFYHLPYNELPLPPKSIIYCDPPYSGTTKYKDNFDHSLFWEWCRQKHKEGHTVYVSEYNAPEDFECIWSKEIVSSLTKDTGSKKGIEKLFTIKK